MERKIIVFFVRLGAACVLASLLGRIAESSFEAILIGGCVGVLAVIGHEPTR